MPELIAQLDSIMPTALTGSVAQTIGTTIAAAGFPAPVGAVAEVQRHSGPPLWAEVVGFRDDFTVLYPLSDSRGVRRGDRVRLVRTSHWVRVGTELLGRVVDAEARAIDGRPQPALADRTSLVRSPPEPCARPRITEPLATGVRAIDGLLTCGKGQRMGVFSGSGIGKSVLLGMMARHTAADVIVIALIGERGREVNEFIERELGAAGLAKSVVVVATSNEPALVRTQAAMTATAVAEYFRDQGKDVLLLMDSLTRFALAQREIGLASGEPPATRGFPPSVFALLPRLVERAGRTAQGSITAFYAVLVEADDPNEPVSDAIRGLLDGHTWLSRKLSSRGHYPAIDVLESVSRLMTDVTDDEQRRAIYAIRDLMAAYRDHEDLISLGAYHRGGNRTVDAAIDVQDELHRYLRQAVEQPASLADAREGLIRLYGRYRGVAGIQE
jgi:flagellum-specific ATP synthase